MPRLPPILPPMASFNTGVNALIIFLFLFSRRRVDGLTHLPPPTSAGGMEGAIDTFRATFRENPITLVGGSWALLVGGTLLYVKQKKIPLQLKIIQARMVAQGALLTGCVRAPLCSHLPIFPLRTLLTTTLPRTRRALLQRSPLSPPRPRRGTSAQGSHPLCSPWLRQWWLPWWLQRS